MTRLDDIKLRQDWAASGSNLAAMQTAVEDDIPWLVERIDAVLALHQPEAWENDAFEYSTEGVGCTECRYDDGGMVDYPCPTARALGVES